MAALCQLIHVSGERVNEFFIHVSRPAAQFCSGSSDQYLQRYRCAAGEKTHYYVFREIDELLGFIQKRFYLLTMLYRPVTPGDDVGLQRSQ